MNRKRKNIAFVGTLLKKDACKRPISDENGLVCVSREGRGHIIGYADIRIYRLLFRGFFSVFAHTVRFGRKEKDDFLFFRGKFALRAFIVAFLYRG